ncbi:hypothetical protein [Ruminococcus sp.]|uniref:hypothetical protein n=1 Tax=Ruminococcus sp. TaxID=41978 RepID=UPI001B6902B1|nr:hypothetical protein [Ruminococcus sp.]MBP5432259.1 hypothetical protein [Ruminococcus sp.]
MHNFSYVSKKEAAPYKAEVSELIKAVQKEVKKNFTFQSKFVGSSSRNMITCERNGNIGYDFDVNIEPNDPEEKYSAETIRKIIFDAFQKHMKSFGYSKIENSTSVITIKAVDRKNSKIVHSCDLAIVYNCNDVRQQYIRYYKGNPPSYKWEFRDKEYYISDKLQWIKENGLMQELRNRYLEYKNRNNNPEKHSRTIFAETVNDLYNEYSKKNRR